MVVCEDGRMKRSDYRKFRVRHEPRLRRRARCRGGPEPGAPGAGTDARERRAALPGRLRRDARGRAHGATGRSLESGGPFPDLIVIDGGKGQLGAAYEALEELGLGNLVAVGLAKQEELVFTRDHADPIAFAPGEPALLLLQQIRDEAHRFAVTFHRKARSLRDLRSELDAVPGHRPAAPEDAADSASAASPACGARRREELVAAVGAKTADAVLTYFSRL